MKHLRLQYMAMQHIMKTCGSFSRLASIMSKENITFRLDSDKKTALDAIAAGMDRDRSYILNEAIAAYLEMHQWQIDEIRQGLTEAEAGDFASEAEVEAMFAKLTHAG
jgi:predicted transcriptional regulator